MDLYLSRECHSVHSMGSEIRRRHNEGYLCCSTEFWHLAQDSVIFSIQTIPIRVLSAESVCWGPNHASYAILLTRRCPCAANYLLIRHKTLVRTAS